MDEEEIRRIRRNVIGLREKQLLPHRAVEHFRSQLFPQRNSC
jgi:hypothetical protein